MTLTDPPRPTGSCICELSPRACPSQQPHARLLICALRAVAQVQTYACSRSRCHCRVGLVRGAIGAFAVNRGLLGADEGAAARFACADAWALLGLWARLRPLGCVWGRRSRSLCRVGMVLGGIRAFTVRCVRGAADRCVRTRGRLSFARAQTLEREPGCRHGCRRWDVWRCVLRFPQALVRQVV